ncbi:MAG: helix-turn-helix domain-containing protein [Candidatus Kryptonium sp.]|nr:helix-turn-helix domain-containing protein [Candidatus Kryptonium sp.]
MTLGEALRIFRRKNNLLQKQMAYMLGITVEYYSKIENDKVFPSQNLLRKICELTRIKINFECKGIKRLKISLHACQAKQVEWNGEHN